MSSTARTGWSVPADSGNGSVTAELNYDPDVTAHRTDRAIYLHTSSYGGYTAVALDLADARELTARLQALMVQVSNGIEAQKMKPVREAGLYSTVVPGPGTKFSGIRPYIKTESGWMLMHSSQSMSPVRDHIVQDEITNKGFVLHDTNKKEQE